MSSAHDDRRRHPRYDVSDLAGVVDGHRPFEALRISAGGMLVRMLTELALDQHVEVELQLGEETFRSGARVVFLGPDLGDHGPAAFRIGLAFVGTPPRACDALEAYIGRELAAPEP